MFSDNGGCTTTGNSGQERKRAEIRLKVCEALSHAKSIGETVESVSFADTLGEIGRVAKGVLSEDRVIPVNSVDMYEIIANNTMADMLSRARFENEDDMVSEDEEVGADFFKTVRMRVRKC